MAYTRFGSWWSWAEEEQKRQARAVEEARVALEKLIKEEKERMGQYEENEFGPVVP